MLKHFRGIGKKGDATAEDWSDPMVGKSVYGFGLGMLRSNAIAKMTCINTDANKLEKLVGWKLKVNFEEGLKITIMVF